MLVLPYLIRDIAGPEISRINGVIRSAAPGDPLHELEEVEDPCPAIVECLLTFMSWYLLIRRREVSADDAADMLVRGREMMERFLTNQERPRLGTSASFMMFCNLPLCIILWGWIENTSGQSGEGAHRELLKALAGCVNNKEVFMQFLRFWEILEQLARAQLEDE